MSSSDSQAPISDLTLLGLIGKALEGGTAQLIVSSTFYGVFLLLFSVSIVTFCLRKSRTSASYLILVTTVLTFLIATLDLAGRISAIYITTSKSLRDERIEAPLFDKVTAVNEKLVYPNIIAEWTTSSATMMSDFVVVWRLWTVIPEERFRAAIVPVLLLLLSTGLTLSYLCRISSPAGIVTVFFGGAPYKLFALSICFSLATNVVATSIFGLKLWRFRQFFTQNGVSREMDVSGTRKRLEHTLLLLIESGLLYCVVQIIYLVMGFVGFNNATGRLGQKIFDVFYFSTSVIYPTLVVVLVNTQRSLADSLRESQQAGEEMRAATRGHLSFAVVASTDDEARSLESNQSPLVRPKTSRAQMREGFNQTKSAP